MKRKISVLGSTGSIGTQTLEVAQFLNFDVVAISANSNIKLLELQARKFKPDVVCVFDESQYRNFKRNIADCSVEVVTGIEGLCKIASLSSVDLVVDAIVGTNGLLPALAAIESGKNCAMACKEALVVGGDLLISKAKERGCVILPIDSEHSAIFQCLDQKNFGSVSKIFLTASGGPFFGRTRLSLENVGIDEALNHPRWSMGRKISIDSATLMNKGLELIEACCLFGIDSDLVEIIVHPQSFLHSAVAYSDGAVIGQFGLTDMRLPIQFALTWPDRVCSLVKSFSFVDCKNLSFFEPDYATFGCLKLCMNAAKQKGMLPIVVHAANEQAVELFLNGKIKFLQIEELIRRATELEFKKVTVSVAEILKTIDYVKNFVMDLSKELV